MKSRTKREYSIAAKKGAQRAKARGVALGNPNIEAARPLALAAVAGDADKHALALGPVIQELQAMGCTTLIALTDELNARNIPTARGGKWYPTTVKNLLARLKR